MLRSLIVVQDGITKGVGCVGEIGRQNKEHSRVLMPTLS